MSKLNLRKEIAVQKKSLSDTDKKTASISVFNTLEDMPEFSQSESILCYWALPDELQTQAFIEKWYRSKNIYLPVVNGRAVDLIQFTGKENMRKGAYNILEPTGDVFTQFQKIDLAIVPGVAFSDDGKRMGRGGGYYDRLLPKLNNAFKLGVAYQLQQRKKIPIEAHDIKLDKVFFG